MRILESERQSNFLAMAQVSRPLDRVGRRSSDLPIFWLGDFVLDTLTRGVENFRDTVHKVMRKWSNDVVVRGLLDVMVLLNPRLNARQQRRLMAILLRVVDQLLWERSLDLRVMRGVVALACPNQDSGFLFAYLMEVMADLAHDLGHIKEFKGPKTILFDEKSPISHPSQKCEEDGRILQTLLQKFCLNEFYVAAMPSKVRKVVFGALNGGLELSSQIESGPLASQHSPPVCCITLEPLLCQDGKITTDVVAVIQKNHTIGKQHAFLYRGQALYDWLGHSQIPRNPNTRSLVKPTDIYRLS